MNAIIVEDEALMIRKFVRMCSDIEDLHINGKFENPIEALEYVKKNSVEVAFLDIELPLMDGIKLACKIREIQKNTIIVFITAFDAYIRDSNNIGADYYLVKPYTKEALQHMMEKIRVLSDRQNKDIYIQTFGRFVVKKNGEPIRIQGKAKEILALIVIKQGKEVSNEELYSVIWEGRPYSNANMAVYYNALRSLKRSLSEAGIDKILLSTSRG
jgi:two-component SAPR family response regulator